MSTEPATRGLALMNLLICDGAHRDPGSGKWTLLGLFDGITCARFPAPPHPQVVIYLVLAGADGKVPVRVQVVPSDRKEEVIARIDAELTVRDKRFMAELPIPFQGLIFPRPADYLIQVFANNRLLGERVLRVAQAPARA
jgi:hypothetical protein